MTKYRSSLIKIKREAIIGDFVEIINAHHVPYTKGRPDYENGDILKIINKTDLPAYGKGCDLNATPRVLTLDEYVVLENYDPEIEYEDFLTQKMYNSLLLSAATDKQILEEQMRRLEAWL